MNKTLVAAGVALACSTAFSPAFAADTIVDSDGKSASIITVRENKTISPGATGGGHLHRDQQAREHGQNVQLHGRHTHGL